MVFFKRKETAGNKETGKLFCRDSGAVSGEHVSRGHYHMHAITHASSGYKIQKKDRAERGEKKGERRTEENWKKKQKRKREGKPEGNDRGKNKGGERAAPALPTPSSAHHLLRPAATAILHHNRTSTAQRKREKQRGEGDSTEEKTGGDNRNGEGKDSKKNTLRRGRITVDRPESAPQAAATSTSTKPLQRGKNIVDRGNKRNKERRSNAETAEKRKSDRSNTTAQRVTGITASSSIQAHHPSSSTTAYLPLWTTTWKKKQRSKVTEKEATQK